MEPAKLMPLEKAIAEAAGNEPNEIAIYSLIFVHFKNILCAYMAKAQISYDVEYQKFLLEEFYDFLRTRTKRENKNRLRGIDAQQNVGAYLCYAFKNWYTDHKLNRFSGEAYNDAIKSYEENDSDENLTPEEEYRNYELQHKAIILAVEDYLDPKHTPYDRYLFTTMALIMWMKETDQIKGPSYENTSMSKFLNRAETTISTDKNKLWKNFKGNCKKHLSMLKDTE